MAGRRTTRFLSLGSAVADVEAWIDQGKPADSMDIVILPPDTVDQVSDEEEFDDDITASGAEEVPNDTPGQVEVHTLEEEPTEVPIISSRKRKRGQAPVAVPKWKKSDKFDVDLACDPPDLLYRSHPELTTMSPFELFRLFFDEEVESLFIEQSNLYAKSKNNHSFKLDAAALTKLIGVIYLSGYHKLPKESLYWSKDDDVHTPIVRVAITRTDFKTMKKYLHFADNRTLDPSDKMAKLRPLIDLLNKKLLQFGVFSKEISIDEQMIPYYGGHPSKQCLRMKPIRFGFKKWLLSSDDGYPFQLDVYQGKKNPSAENKAPLGTRVVKQFVEVLEDPSKHELYIDNLFTSYNLMVELQEMGIRATGTVRANRVNKCPLMDDKQIKKKNRGFLDYRGDGKVIVI